MMRPARSPFSSMWGSTVFASCTKSPCSSLALGSHIQNRMRLVECVFDHAFAPMNAGGMLEPQQARAAAVHPWSGGRLSAQWWPCVGSRQTEPLDPARRSRGRGGWPRARRDVDQAPQASPLSAGTLPVGRQGCRGALSRRGECWLPVTRAVEESCPVAAGVAAGPTRSLLQSQRFSSRQRDSLTNSSVPEGEMDETSCGDSGVTRPPHSCGLYDGGDRCSSSRE